MHSKNQPTKAQRERWGKIASLNCIICGDEAQIHHCGTGAGGRKNHDKVLPLCVFHHVGKQGIHTIGRKTWREKYGTEEELMATVSEMVDMP